MKLDSIIVAEFNLKADCRKNSLVTIKDPVENLRQASKVVDCRELQTNRHLEETGKQQTRKGIRQNQTQAEHDSKDKKREDGKRRPNVSSQDHRNNGREADTGTLAIVSFAED